jgi:glycosyltransferase involved in cell wall biosynthesis
VRTAALPRRSGDHDWGHALRILLEAPTLGEASPPGTSLEPPLPRSIENRRCHLCVVTDTYPPEINGVALTLARLVDGLRTRGHTVSLVRPRRPSDPPGPEVDPTLTLVPGLPLPGYPGLRVGLPPRALLRERWGRGRPDAVYVATEGPLGWSALGAARRLGVGVLSGFHTNFHGYARHYHGGWLAWGVARYLRCFHNRTDRTLVATTDLRDQLHARGFENLSVLGRGVDGRLFTPERRCHALRGEWGMSGSDPVVLYVGRLAAEKNIGLAIAAYRAMQRHHPSLRFVLVGDGPLRAALQRAHPDLVFCGAHTGERLAAHYASGDVFLFPSETETFGNVTLEAMASGLVVVAYDYAAARMHIAHGETGTLIPYGDARAFVEGAAALLRSPKGLDRMRRRARESVARLAWDRVVERFEVLLTDAIER